jgi:hypothetical protein
MVFRIRERLNSQVSSSSSSNLNLGRGGFGYRALLFWAQDYWHVLRLVDRDYSG